MGLLISVNGSLETPTDKLVSRIYPAVDFGKPLGIQMLAFFPGNNIDRWGNKAELMVTSQVRIGPSNEPAPRLVNMLLRNYNFRRSNPVTDYGGDVYGDRMFYYTKAYAGQRIGITLRGVEIDKLGKRTWEGITRTISGLGHLALFTSAAPYFAAAGLAVKMANTLLRAIMKNDRLITQSKDFFFNEPNHVILQSGRYLLWEGNPKAGTVKSKFRLTGRGDPIPNLLVSKKDGALYKVTAYFVLQIDGRKREAYNDFEIGAASSEILERWGDKEAGAVIFKTIRELAGQVNDARHLSEIMALHKKLKHTRSKTKKNKLREMMNAHTKLLSDDNGYFLKDLLKPVLKPPLIHNS